MLLPWEYGVRNLARRPLRTGLTLLALVVVVLLVLVVVGFIRGLERSLTVSGDEDVMLIYSVNSEENLENSAISAQVPQLVAASFDGTWQRFGIAHVSPELFLGTRVATDTGQTGPGLVRGVTRRAPLVRRSVRLLDGTWPKTGEVLVGRLAAAKIGIPAEALSVGQKIQFEGGTWTVSGTFAADGAAWESELWCLLDDFQTATKRQDISLVALLLAPDANAAELSLFCKERTDLELRTMKETDYYAGLQKHYRPVRLMAWTVVLLTAAAGVFVGLNMMYGAVAGRVRELATLQALGYRRIAIVISLLQESLLLSAAASLLSGSMALTVFHGLAVRFTMGAFRLQIDGTSILVGCGVGLLLGCLGAIPPAIRALRAPVAISLKAI
ncbi:MAG: ABC transporter permease [Fuerstiella sp.]